MRLYGSSLPYKSSRRLTRFIGPNTRKFGSQRSPHDHRPNWPNAARRFSHFGARLRDLKHTCEPVRRSRRSNPPCAFGFAPARRVPEGAIFRNSGTNFAAFVENFFRFVTFFIQSSSILTRSDVSQIFKRNLMLAPSWSSDWLPSLCLDRFQPLGRTQNDHRPTRHSSRIVPLRASFWIAKVVANSVNKLRP